MDITPIKTTDVAASPGPAPGASLPEQGKSGGDQMTLVNRPTDEQIRKMVADINAQLSSMNISINFSTYGPNNNKIAIVVTDKISGKVIREIPAKEIQQLYKNIDSLVGMFVNGAA